MPNYSPLTGQELFDAIVDAYNAEATTPANTGRGSQLGSQFKASVLLALQLQQQVAYQFAVSRLATSYGADVDSLVEPFGVKRGGDTPASGLVTVTYPVGQSQVILVDTQFQTATGVTFTAIADPNNTTGFFNVQLNGYVANPNANIIVQCNDDGLIGNVLANTITLPYGGFPALVGSPTITNSLAFSNAIATETDQALKTRFAQYISGGGEGTVNSIIAATSAVQSGTTFSYGDQWAATNILTGPDSAYTLTPNLVGNFSIIANIANQPTTAGSGALCAAITDAILYAVRPAGIMFNVLPPTILPVNGAGKIVLIPGYPAAVVLAAVSAAYTNFVNGIGLGQYGAVTVCAISQVATALQAVPGVAYIDNITLNGYGADVQGPFGTQLVAGTTTGFTN